jgi:amino acid permease
MMLIVFSAPAFVGPLLFLMVAPLGLLCGVALFDLLLSSLLTTEIIVSSEVIPSKWLKRSKKR